MLQGPKKTDKGVLGQILSFTGILYVETAIGKNFGIIAAYKGVNGIFVAVFHFLNQKKVRILKEFDLS